MPKDATSALPKGYIANDTDARNYALDSAELVKSGIYRSGRIGSDFRFEALDCNGDSRLERLRRFAFKLKHKYADPESKHFIEDIAKREKTIADRLLERVYKEYGPYCEKTAKDGFNKEEQRMMGNNEKTSYLRKMEYGTLVCRHYAPIMSILMHEAGVPNYIMNSPASTQGIERSGSTDFFQYPPSFQATWHAYVITKEGNASVDGTVAGKKDAKGYPVSPYEPIVNGVTPENVVYKNAVAFANAGNGYYDLLGGNIAGKTNQEMLNNARKSYVNTVESYNDGVQFGKQMANTMSWEKTKDVLAQAKEAMNGALYEVAHATLEPKAPPAQNIAVEKTPKKSL